MGDKLAKVLDGPKPPQPPEAPEQEAQIAIVPIALWGQIVKRLGKMSYEDVGDIMPHVMQIQIQQVQVKQPPKKE